MNIRIVCSMLFLFVIGFIAMQSCKKTPALPPEQNTYFKIRKNGTFLTDSILLKTELFYIGKNGSEIHDPDDIETNQPGIDIDDTAFMYVAYGYYRDTVYKQTDVAFFRYIAIVSAQEGIHSFI